MNPFENVSIEIYKTVASSEGGDSPDEEVYCARVILPNPEERGSFSTFILWQDKFLSRNESRIFITSVIPEPDLVGVLIQFFSDPHSYMLEHHGYEYHEQEAGAADHEINFEELDL